METSIDPEDKDAMVCPASDQIQIEEKTERTKSITSPRENKNIYSAMVSMRIIISFFLINFCFEVKILFSLSVQQVVYHSSCMTGILPISPDGSGIKYIYKFDICSLVFARDFLN